MEHTLRAIVRTYVQNNTNEFIDKLEAATSMVQFKQWVVDEARQDKQRKIAKQVDELGLELSEESTGILHEYNDEG